MKTRREFLIKAGMCLSLMATVAVFPKHAMSKITNGESPKIEENTNVTLVNCRLENIQFHNVGHLSMNGCSISGNSQHPGVYFDSLPTNLPIGRRI